MKERIRTAPNDASRELCFKNIRKNKKQIVLYFINEMQH
jgi:hypothetical protein